MQTCFLVPLYTSMYVYRERRTNKALFRFPFVFVRKKADKCKENAEKEITQ